MIVLIDNGHGINTAGKCSPDKRLCEYKYAREVACLLEEELTERGVKAIRIVPEDTDISLQTRVARVNRLCEVNGANNCLLVSIHCNACPPNDNKWHAARGWSAWTSKGKTKGDFLAECLYDAAEIILNWDYVGTFTDDDWKRKNKPIRTDMSDGDRDFEESFTILTKTRCAAVLTENLFQDNKDDVNFLLSEEGKNDIVNIHLTGIMSYIKSF